MIRWKDSVSFEGLHGAMSLATARIHSWMLVFSKQEDLWITSANDGKHKPGSKHYEGRAFDYRTKGCFDSDGQRDAFVRTVQVGLGPQFVVLLEDAGTPNEHLHVHYNGI